MALARRARAHELVVHPEVEVGPRLLVQRASYTALALSTIPRAHRVERVAARLEAQRLVGRAKRPSGVRMRSQPRRLTAPWLASFAFTSSRWSASHRSWASGSADGGSSTCRNGCSGARRRRSRCAARMSASDARAPLRHRAVRQLDAHPSRRAAAAASARARPRDDGRDEGRRGAREERPAQHGASLPTAQ